MACPPDERASRAEVVAIDGPAGAGKSSVARSLAEALGWAYLDTGAMYRAVTLAAQRRGIAVGDGPALAALARGLALELSPTGRVRLGGEDVTPLLRTPAINEGVSLVAGVADVRSVMVGHQRRFAAANGRIVAEGRDIGTVVFPQARVKVFLDASEAERARRRLEESRGEQPGADLEGVRAGLARRDHLDSTRAASPLQRAPDAWYLDTSGKTLAEVSALVLGQVRSALRLVVGG